MSDARFQPPAWLLLDTGTGLLEVRDLERGDGFDVQGELREQVLRDPLAARPVLEAMGGFDATVARFARQLGHAAPEPLGRAALLRGAGFEQLFVELTARCNERCVHCYAGSSPEREETLPLELVDAALVDARALGFRAVQLTGGDPLVSPHCAAVAARVRELGFESLEVYTNGLALRGALYDTLRDLRAAFAFSFYAADPAVHDAMTQTPGSHARTLAAIRRVASDGLPLRASVVLDERNAAQLDATLALLEGAGVPADVIAIDQVRAVGRGEFEPALASGDWANRGRRGHTADASRGFAGKAAIAPDGQVYPCIFSRELPLGSLHERPLRDVLAGQGAPPVDPAVALARAGSLVGSLSCWECRLRGALLGAGAAVEGLTPLVRRGAGT